MATKIFVNLPVKDLKKSMDFFTKLGYTFNPQFTDDTAACMVSMSLKKSSDQCRLRPSSFDY